MQGFSYDELYSMLQTWPVETASEYLADLPKIIRLGETRLVRDLNLELFDRTDRNLLIEAGVREVGKPEDLIQVRYLMAVDDDGHKHLIEQRSQAYCELYGSDPTITGIPKYYCELSEQEWLMVPTADQDYSIEAKMVLRPDGLSADQQHTWLGDRVGDALFAACLMEVEHWIKADDRYGDMKTKYYEELLPAARAELRNSIRAGEYSPVKPAAKTVE
jgi:hypothetical protein